MFLQTRPFSPQTLIKKYPDHAFSKNKPASSRALLLQQGYFTQPAPLFFLFNHFFLFIFWLCTIILFLCVTYIWYFHFTMVLWIPENALKSRVLYLEMLSLSFSVSSSPRYNCRIWIATSKCNRADKVHFTLVPSGSGDWLHCEVLNVKPVSRFIFVLNLMWTYFSML